MKSFMTFAVADQHDILARDGAALARGACSTNELATIEGALSSLPKGVAGVRLAGFPKLNSILEYDGAIGMLASALIGLQARPVRVLFFDKSESNNWALGWHQDRTIVVKERFEVEGFGPWTVKAGLQHVAPPAALLSRMLTIRLHLDPVSKTNAPLVVALGSHRRGRIAERDVKMAVEQSETLICLADRGDAWIYSTPILHASGRATKPQHRRVLQVDYASEELPRPLEWLGI